MLTMLRIHLLHSAAVAATSMPISALFELFVLRLSPPVAAKVRIYMLLLILLGIGTGFAMLRDKSLRVTSSLHIGSAWRITLHDLAFILAVNSVIIPIIYTLSGATVTQIVVATALSAFLSVFTGPLNGAAVDLFRAAAGYPSARRFGLDKKTRPLLIVALVCLSAVLTFALFAIASA
jgi:hypothetical protein